MVATLGLGRGDLDPARFRGWLEQDAVNVHPVGRNGMHKYNNQDHAMMTAMLTVRNILAGERLYDVLLIDEALATGDATFRQKSADRITQIRERAGTVFLVSHSNSNIRDICDRVLWMDQGRLLMDGPTEEVLQAYEASVR